MTRWKNLFIAAYLIIQVVLPLRGCLYEKFETNGNFSWNMYSRRYGCRTQYRLDTPEGETRWLSHRDYFNRPELSTRVFYVDVLPEYHRWLCGEFHRRGELGSIRGYASCPLKYGLKVSLVERSVDLCNAPNYGVRVQKEALK